MRYPAIFIGIAATLAGCQTVKPSAKLDLNDTENWSGLDYTVPYSFVFIPDDATDCPEIVMDSKGNKETIALVNFDNLEDKLIWLGKSKSDGRSVFYFHNRSDDWSCVMGVEITYYGKKDFIPNTETPGPHQAETRE